ncbi:MAG TPA: ABC transporter permease [Anaerolineae bacterium]|nr:ABC transporter permease [Anaerolineae bacterium]
MRKAWLVARHEYLTMVRKRSFVLATLAFPVLISAFLALTILLAQGRSDDRPLGAVDLAGVLIDRAWQAGDSDVAFLPFASEAAALAALQAGRIQAYYLLPAGYRESGEVQLTALSEAPPGAAQRAFDAMLRAGLLADQPAAVQQRLTEGVSLTVRSADGRREFSQSNFINLLLPFVAGFFFIYAVLSSAGYLLQAVTTEKENRTVEIMATTLSPDHLIAGKALGLLAVALTQLAVWVAAIVLGLAVGAAVEPLLRSVQIPWPMLAVVLLYFLPSFALIGGMMIAIGSVFSDIQQGQQVAGILNLLFMAPFFVLIVLFANPDGPLAVGMTLFPTTSFLTVLIRWGLTTVPLWQLALSWLLLAASAAASVWAAARVYRAGMLQYGQRLSGAAIKAALRGQPPADELAH